ncbi:MAG: rod shape-determining protein MreD [Magnetospirillum sp.]|nr:rod shape-determining protein MreD [Magnetospirillum sp.]
MKPSPWVRMDAWVRHFIPFGVTLILLFAAALPTHLPGIGGIAPMLPMMGVYYWAIYRPDLLPAWSAFLIGLLYDVLSGTPMGVYALVLLLVQGVAASRRRFFLAKTFMVAWWAFSLLAAGAVVLAWLLMAVLNGAPSDPRPLLSSYLATIGLFPLFTWTLARTQMALLKDV